MESERRSELTDVWSGPKSFLLTATLMAFSRMPKHTHTHTLACSVPSVHMLQRANCVHSLLQQTTCVCSSLSSRLCWKQAHPHPRPNLITHISLSRPSATRTNLSLSLSIPYPCRRVSKVLISLCSLLNDPNPNDPLVGSIAQQVRRYDDIRYIRYMRYTIYDMI